MHRHLSVFFLSAALLAPAVLVAQDRDDRDHDRNSHRYYDAERHDYHQWNEAEQRAWRHYLEERHERYRAWEKANRREQQEYWRWRHAHPDAAIPPDRR